LKGGSETRKDWWFYLIYESVIAKEKNERQNFCYVNVTWVSVTTFYTKKFHFHGSWQPMISSHTHNFDEWNEGILK
jgi:hypothetical protein